MAGGGAGACPGTRCSRGGKVGEAESGPGTLLRWGGRVETRRQNPSSREAGSRSRTRSHVSCPAVRADLPQKVMSFTR
jgi:hypothetical protein